MTINEILDALAAGNYRIEYEDNCDCTFGWDVVAGGMDDGCHSDNCWEGNILYVGDTAVAQHLRYEGREVLVDGVDDDDIDEDIWDAMDVGGDIVERGDSGNCASHDANRRDALISYLLECGYVLERDDEQGFANCYTMILREPKPGEVYTPPTEAEAAEWADGYLYSGDAATEAYNSFRFISADEDEDE